MEYATNGCFEGYKAVDETKCTGCRKCVEVCPYGAFDDGLGSPDGQKSVKNQLRWCLMMVLEALTGRNPFKNLI